jgi:hypothetical protein
MSRRFIFDAYVKYHIEQSQLTCATLRCLNLPRAQTRRELLSESTNPRDTRSSNDPTSCYWASENLDQLLNRE